MESLVQKAFERNEMAGERVEQPTQAPIENTQNLPAPEDFGLDVKEAKIMVVGVGGAGNNCVTRLHDIGINGAQTITINTDVKHLRVSRSDKRVLIGKETTKGLGAGGYPETGRKAAEENEKDLKKVLDGCDMLYLV